MKRRTGATLLEVLVAMFVMAIGMLALLTLFPLGALRMAKAIQDQRCFEAGNNAWSIGAMKSVAQDPGLYPPSGNPSPVVLDPFLNPLTLIGPNAFAPNAHPDFPSYPVYVDPLGWYAVAAVPQQQQLGNRLSFIARRSLSFIRPPNGPNGPIDLMQWQTGQDDIDFESAQPNTGNSPPGSARLIVPPPTIDKSQMTRDTRYSMAYLLQRPRYSDATVIDTSIVVYNKRPLTFTGLGLPETVYNNATFTPSTNTITVPYGNNVPLTTRVGDWLLDCTPYNLPNSTGSAHGYFYRVVAVTDVGGNNMEFQVEQPIRGFPLPFPAVNPPFTGTVLVLDGVAEVFLKGTSR